SPQARGGLLEDLALLRLLHQRGRRLEVAAVALRQFTRPRDEALEPALVLVHVLHHTTGPRRETDPEDRADVGVLHRVEHAFVEALDRLQRLGEQHPLLEVLERHVSAAAAPGLPQPRPQSDPLAVLVVLVEPGTEGTTLAV